MPLTFNQDPCTDLENEYRDNNLFKRSVLRILCKLVPSAVTLLGKVGLIDASQNDITPANPLPVTGNVVVTSMPPVSVTLPPGASTSANQLTEIAKLTSIDGKITACDTGNVTITAMPAIALPAGASTSANQLTEIASLASIDGKIVTCDTSNISGTVSVTNGAGAAAVNIQDGGNSITVDGSVSVSSLPAGIATSANQATEIASLSSIDTKLTSQATAANQALEVASLSSIDSVAQVTQAIITTLKAIFSFLTRGLWLDSATGSVRAVLGVGSSSTLAAVTTVSTVTAVSNVVSANGYNFYAAPQSISNATWALQVRAMIL